MYVFTQGDRLRREGPRLWPPAQGGTGYRRRSNTIDNHDDNNDNNNNNTNDNHNDSSNNNRIIIEVISS